MADVRDTDKGWTKLVQMASDADKVVRVGIQGDEATAPHGGDDGEANDDDDGELTNVKLGTIHEYGAPLANIVERPFIRSTLDERADEYVRMARQFAQDVIDGSRTREQALGLLGERVRADIIQRINDGRVEPDIKEATKKRKGKSRALIDSGQLKGSITYVVGSKR